jgi:hypothetical protein
MLPRHPLSIIFGFFLNIFVPINNAKRTFPPYIGYENKEIPTARKQKGEHQLAFRFLRSHTNGAARLP